MYNFIENKDQKWRKRNETASTVLTLRDGIKIQSSAYSISYRGLLENLNENYSGLNAQQLAALSNLVSGDRTMLGWGLYNLTGHRHCLCAGGMDHSCQGTLFTPLSQESIDNATSSSAGVRLTGSNYRIMAGSYYLTEDITVAGQILLYDETALCLNGNALVSTGSRALAVCGAIVDVADCVGTGSLRGNATGTGATILIQGSGGAAAGDPSVLSLYAGTVYGGASNAEGGTVYMADNQTLNIYGGTVYAGTAKTANGIYLPAGATVRGGSNYNLAAAILVNSNQKMNLYGGKILSGSARIGNGVYVAATAVWSLGGNAQIDEIYMSGTNGFTASTDYPLTADDSVALDMSKGGVFASGITSDLSACFRSLISTQEVVYDPTAQTLSLVTIETE